MNSNDVLFLLLLSPTVGWRFTCKEMPSRFTSKSLSNFPQMALTSSSPSADMLHLSWSLPIFLFKIYTKRICLIQRPSQKPVYMFNAFYVGQMDSFWQNSIIHAMPSQTPGIVTRSLTRRSVGNWLLVYKLLNVMLWVVLICMSRTQFSAQNNKCCICTWYLQNIPRITLFLRNTKQYNHLSNVSLKIVPLCNYTLFPATINVLQTFLESIMLEPF